MVLLARTDQDFSTDPSKDKLFTTPKRNMFFKNPHCSVSKVVDTKNYVLTVC